MEGFYNKHYVRLDESSQIIYGFSDAFEQPQEGDICINEQGGYQFRLFPNGEENPALIDDKEGYIFRYVNGKVSEIPDAEKVYPELQPYIDPIQQVRADVDYIAIMTGVEL